MKNEVLKFGLLYLFIGLVISSCSTSHTMTSCPDFKSKNKKGVFALAKKSKKKHKKVSTKVVNAPVKIDASFNKAALVKQNTIAPINSINNFISVANEELNLLNPAVHVPSPITKSSKVEEDILNNETASTKDLMEITPFAKLKSLGIDHIQYDESISTLSKKDIKAIKKRAKKELKKKLQEEKGSNAKLAAIISYLGLIGFLIAYLAIHEKGNEFSGFHIRQALGIGLLILLPFPIALAGLLGLLIASALSIAVFVMWLMGIIGAAQGEKKPVFLLGNFFQNIFKGIE